jgi:hypothetical protein
MSHDRRYRNKVPCRFGAHDVLPRRPRQTRQLTEKVGKQKGENKGTHSYSSRGHQRLQQELQVQLGNPYLRMEVVRVPVVVRKGCERGANGTQTHREMGV